jgi:hypothetical protein
LINLSERTIIALRRNRIAHRLNDPLPVKSLLFGGALTADALA